MWIPRPRFAYSLYNFYGATIKIKGSLLKSIASVMRFLLNSLGQISTFLGEKLATGPYSIISIQLTWSFSQNFSLMSGLISICGFTFWYTEPYTHTTSRNTTRVHQVLRKLQSLGIAASVSATSQTPRENSESHRWRRRSFQRCSPVQQR